MDISYVLSGLADQLRTLERRPNPDEARRLLQRVQSGDLSQLCDQIQAALVKMINTGRPSTMRIITHSFVHGGMGEEYIVPINMTMGQLRDFLINATGQNITSVGTATYDGYYVELPSTARVSNYQDQIYYIPALTFIPSKEPEQITIFAAPNIDRKYIQSYYVLPTDTVSQLKAQIIERTGRPINTILTNYSDENSALPDTTLLDRYVTNGTTLWYTIVFPDEVTLTVAPFDNPSAIQEYKVPGGDTADALYDELIPSTEEPMDYQREELGYFDERVWTPLQDHTYAVDYVDKLLLYRPRVYPEIPANENETPVEPLPTTQEATLPLPV